MGDLFPVDNWVYGKNKKYQSELKEPTLNSLSVISGVTENNGTNYYTEDSLSEEEVFESELTISTRGEYSGTVFYHKEKFVLANNILVMSMPSLSENQKIFIGSLINSLPYGGYSGYPRKETLKNDTIQLPTKNGEIDFQFMEDFITELEAEKMKRLGTYLEASGLKDYTLTLEEEQVLADFENGNIEWGEFIIGDLFEITHYGKQRSKEDLQKEGIGKFNFVMQNENDNGVIQKVPEQIGNHFNLIPGNSISAFTHLNRVYYQETPFYSKQGSNIYTLRANFLNKQNSKFIISSINTNIREVEYGKNTASRLKHYTISLIVKNSEPDYKTMETLISAIQKIMIKDVVLYCEQKAC